MEERSAARSIRTCESVGALGVHCFCLYAQSRAARRTRSMLRKMLRVVVSWRRSGPLSRYPSARGALGRPGSKDGSGSPLCVGDGSERGGGGTVAFGSQFLCKLMEPLFLLHLW